MTSHSDGYKIEKNIPVPGRANNARWKELVEQMEVGDSVLVHSRNEAMNIRNAIVIAGFRCVTRGNDTKTPRVWKLLK